MDGMAQRTSETGSKVSQLIIQEAVEELRKGLADGLVEVGQQYMLILTKRGQGFEIHIEWTDQPPEDYDFLEENQLLTWWDQFIGAWLLK
jgi:4-aminobutyrate aminotransferase-like enzyme